MVQSISFDRSLCPPVAGQINIWKRIEVVQQTVVGRAVYVVSYYVAERIVVGTCLAADVNFGNQHAG